jgi:hypothetical protein
MKEPLTRQASVHKWIHQAVWPHVPIYENNKASQPLRIDNDSSIPNYNYNYNNTLIMLLLPTFLIFVSLSVAAIPLGPSPNGQTPHIRRIPSVIPAGLTKSLPPPAGDLLPSLAKILPRFIMGADYASSSGPFLGKSPHKRQVPISGPLGSGPLGPATQSAADLTDDFPPRLSPGSTPT